MQIRVKAIVAFLTTAVLILAGCSNNPTPTEPAAPTITAVNATYTWIGLAGGSGYTFTADCTGDTCRTTATCSPMAMRGDGVDPTPLPESTVDAEAVSALGVIVKSAKPATEPTEVIEHTDDYPNYTIELTTDSGEKLTVSSTSNTADNTPWNLERGGKLYVNKSSAFSKAHSKVAAAALGNNCTR